MLEDVKSFYFLRASRYFVGYVKDEDYIVLKLKDLYNDGDFELHGFKIIDNQFCYDYIRLLFDCDF